MRTTLKPEHLAELIALRQWHRDHGTTELRMAGDGRASRHSKKDHERAARFHSAASQTLTRCIAALTTQEQKKDEPLGEKNK